jgi:hypothetical protein
MNTMQPSNANTLLAEEMTSPAPVLGHSALHAEAGVRARDTADRIRTRQKEQIVAIIENGQDLLTMREQLGVYSFRAWLQAQCEISEHLARKYMYIAMLFGNRINSFPDLPLEVLYKLTASTISISVWITALGYLERGQRLTVDEINHLILEERWAKKTEKRAKKAEQAVKKAGREAKLTP